MTAITSERKPLLRLPFSLTPGFLAWLGFLGLCILIGLLSAEEVFRKGLVLTNMTNNVPWGLWITIDLSSIALGAGAFTLSAVVYLFGLKRFQSIIRLAVYVGFIGYTCALLTLIMDIGRPDRFWHPWVYWNIHSVLWEITMCITIYLAIMVLEFAPVVFETKYFNRWPWLRTAANIMHKGAPLLALLGLIISLLHQSSLGATYGIIKARPIWFKPSMPIMFILSAVAAGPAVTMGIALIAEWISGKRLVEHDILYTIARFSGLATLVYGYIKFWDLAATTYYGQSPNVISSLKLLGQQTPYNFTFWVGEVLLGIVVPALLFLSPRFNRNPAFLVLGAMSAFVGIIVHRWNITVGGLYVPLSFSPGTLYKLPTGNYHPALVEWGIAIGIIGYALTMLTIGIRFLPLFGRKER